MAYEERENGTHAMGCEGCDHELIAPGKDELLEDLALAGWTAVGPDQFVCNHCAKAKANKSPLQQMFGDNVIVQAPGPVHKGDPFHDANGDVVGHYDADAQQGDEVGVTLDDPEPEPQVSSLQRYDAMMEGTDADDDAVGRVSAVAPAGGPAGAAGGGVADTAVDHRAQAAAAPTPRSLERPAGEPGSGGVVQRAPEVDTTSAEAKARLARAPQRPAGPEIDTDALMATSNIFDNLDTSWDPDDA